MATNPKPSPESQSFVQDQAQMLSKFLQDGQQILSFLLASVLLLALISYDFADGGWSVTAVNAVQRNWLGQFGAYTSDLLLMMMGYAAYWLPVALYYKVLRNFLQRYDLAPRFTQCLQGCLQETRKSVSLSSFILLCVSTATLAGLHFYHPDHELPNAVGGVIGESLTFFLLHWVGAVLATLCMLVLWVVGLTFSLGISWLRLMDEIGFYAEKAALRLFRWGQAESRESRAGLPEDYAVDNQLSPFLVPEADGDQDDMRHVAPRFSQKKQRHEVERIDLVQHQQSAPADDLSVDLNESTKLDPKSTPLLEKTESLMRRYWQQLPPLFKSSTGNGAKKSGHYQRVEPDLNLDPSLTFDASTFTEPKVSVPDMKINSEVEPSLGTAAPDQSGRKPIGIQEDDSLQHALTQLIRQQEVSSQTDERDEPSKQR